MLVAIVVVLIEYFSSISRRSHEREDLSWHFMTYLDLDTVLIDSAKAALSCPFSSTI